jgi:hypothetical protein
MNDEQDHYPADSMERAVATAIDAALREHAVGEAIEAALTEWAADCQASRQACEWLRGAA